MTHGVLLSILEVQLMLLSELLESVFMELTQEGLGLDGSSDKGSKESEFHI